VYCDCGVLFCVGMVYRILGVLCVLTVLCCCASVLGTVYEGFCIFNVVCCCASL